MFETTFTYTSASPIPPNLSTDSAISILHDFETVIRLSPDCKGCKPIPPPKNGYAKSNGAGKGTVAAGPMSYYEVEDDLPFMPRKMWSGGVKYTADFLPVDDGCDITVHAPGGFTSTNHWRLQRETNTDAHNLVHPNNMPIPEHEELQPDPGIGAALDRVATKDLLHADSSGAGWYVQIVSDAKCPKAFAGLIKGTLKNSHAQLQHAFIERLQATPQQQKQGRPGLGRRRSTNF